MPIVALKNVRIAFPDLFVAKAFGDGAPTYGAAFLLDRKHPQVAEVNKAIEQAAAEKWGVKAPVHMKAIKAVDKLCIHDGDNKAQYNGYEGNWFINARSPEKKRPKIIDRDKSPLVAADGKPYGGCYVNASIEIYAQDNSFGKRINADLRGVQFLKDGESFGGGSVASDDEFDDLANTGDDNDLA